MPEELAVGVVYLFHIVVDIDVGYGVASVAQRRRYRIFRYVVVCGKKTPLHLSTLGVESERGIAELDLRVSRRTAAYQYLRKSPARRL